jgi:hypothetical protein
MGRLQVLGDVPTTAGLFDPHPIEAPPAVCFPRLTHHLGWRAVAFGQLAVSITPIRPGDKFTAAGVLSASAARALEQLGALILGAHRLHLAQQPTFGISRLITGNSSISRPATRTAPHQFAHIVPGLAVAVHPNSQGRGIGSSLPDGRQVKRGYLQTQIDWLWRHSPQVPGMRYARLRATSPTYGAVTIIVVSERR